MFRNQALWLGLTGMVAACGGTDPTPGYDQVAQGIGAMIAEPNGGESLSYEDAIIAAGGSLPAEMTLDSPGKLSGKRDDVEYKIDLSCAGASSCDLKFTWKGKVESAHYKVELDREASWKVDDLDQATVRVSGKGRFHTKTELKDEAYKSKYDYDYDADYKDVLVRAADRVIVGGRIDYDVHAKLHEATDSEKIKEEYHIKAKVTFDGDGQVTIDLDEKYKYKLHLSTGEIIKESVTVK